MAKEFHEQPEVVGHTIAHYVDMGAQRLRPFAWPVDPKEISRVSIVGCGTAYMAGLIGKYWIERFARLPVEIDVASEYRYREAPGRKGRPDDLHFAIGRNRRHARLAALRQGAGRQDRRRRQCRDLQHRAPGRRRRADPGRAGDRRRLDQGLHLSARDAGVPGARRLRAPAARSAKSRKPRWWGNSSPRPDFSAEALKLEPSLEQIAHKLARARDVLYLGRGTAYPIALEGALKLKELSYIHAEGYAAGELKHGPIALIDEDMPVIVIAPRDAVFEKTVSNMQEVAARGGRIILIGERHAAEEAALDLEGFLAMPDMAATFAPIVYAAPVQMLAYHTAVIMGKDADQPRNLAKSVTVE